MGGWAVGMLAFLTVQPLNRLAAQVSLRLSLGGRYSTALVHDSLVVPIDLHPALAPTLQLGLRDEFKGPWTGDLTLDLSSSKLKRHESGSDLDAGSVTAVALTFGLRRDLAPNIGARFGIGGLVYSGSNLGVFQQGSGGILPLVSLATTYTPAFGARHGIELALQYDFHRFVTPALRSVGFNHPRPVHRIAISVSGRLLGK
jgi:hypothetical protein